MKRFIATLALLAGLTQAAPITMLDVPDNTALYDSTDPFAIGVSTAAYTSATNANARLDSLSATYVHINNGTSTNQSLITATIPQKITFGQSTSGNTYEIGEVGWDADNETYSFGLGNSVVGQAFYENFIAVENHTGVQINNGAVVYDAGGVGMSGKIKAGLFVANGSIDPCKILGVATEDIPQGAQGRITHFGKVRGIDLDGSVYGETWTNGVEVFASTNVAGGLTIFEPPAPYPSVSIGVVNAAANNGTLSVRPYWHPKMTDLTDVNGTPLTTSGQFPVWNQTLGVFDFTANTSDFLTEVPSYVVTNNGSATLDDITVTHRMALGFSTSVNNIDSQAYGAAQLGGFGGNNKIGLSGAGAMQRGWNDSNMSSWFIDALGASQFGYTGEDSGIAVTNLGSGALQVFALNSANLKAITTSGGAGSLMIGGGTASNLHAIVVGNGSVSHGDNSITAGGGFYGSGTGITGMTVSQISGAYPTTNPSNYTDYATVTNIVLANQEFSASLYGWGSTTSTVEGAYLLTNGLPGGVKQTITVTGVTNNQYVAKFITGTNQRFTRISQGTVNVEFSVNKAAAGACSVRPEFYILDANGTTVAEYETASATTPLTTTETPYNISIPIPSNITITASNRIGVYLKALVTSGTPNVFIYSEDAANFVVQVPVPSAEFVTQSQLSSYVPNTMLNFTNGTFMADGVLNGTNGFFFVPPGSTNRYWILGGN